MSGVDWAGRDGTPGFVISYRHAGTRVETLSTSIWVKGEWRWLPASRPQCRQSSCACAGGAARPASTSNQRKCRAA